MNIPVGNKKVINVPGWAVVVGGLIIDNMVANICRLVYATKAITKKEK